MIGSFGDADDLLGESWDDDRSDDLHSFGGVWTRIKLEALEKYLHAFNTALSKQHFKRIYIDAFAGTGRCEINVDGEKTTIEGSARRALATHPAFHKYYFIELRSKKLAALRALAGENPGKDIEVVRGDANQALKKLCSQYRWLKERAVLFLDPFGMHVEWSTLESIANTGAIDVWYLFPYAGLYRQAAKNSEALDADKEASLTRVLGTTAWRSAFYMQKRQQDLFSTDDRDERSASHSDMLSFVSNRLKKLFPAVTDPKILYKGGNSRSPIGAPLFALYFAASNPKPSAYRLATKIAKEILDTL